MISCIDNLYNYYCTEQASSDLGSGEMKGNVFSVQRELCNNHDLD